MDVSGAVGTISAPNVASVSFSHGGFGPTTTTEYTCPRGTVAYAFLASASFLMGAASSVAITIYNGSHTSLAISSGASSDVTYPTMAPGVIMLKEGETIRSDYSSVGSSGPVTAANVTMLIFEMSLIAK